MESSRSGRAAPDLLAEDNGTIAAGTSARSGNKSRDRKGAGKREAEGWEEALDPPLSPSWSLPAAWGENAASTNEDAPPRPSPPKTAHRPARKSPTKQPPSSKRAAEPRPSPGALLRLQSSTNPQPFPLADLMRLTTTRHTLPMTSILHSMASLSRAGREHAIRKTNQDCCFAFRQYVRPHQAIAGVFDGHGPQGHSVSAFVKEQLPALVATQLRRRGEVAAAAALTTAFLETNAALRAAAGAINSRLSGSTAVVTLLQGTRLTTAWVGDSRSVIVRRDSGGGGLRAVPLTQDHKPTSAGELARIMAAGGRVERLSDHHGREVGPHRVWLPGSWVPGLAMSRALGDQVAHSVGVTAQPDTSVVEVQAGDEWLVLASDGVWEFMGMEEVAAVVGGCASAEEACQALVDAATQSWAAMDEGITDDITVVAVKFLPLAQLSRKQQQQQGEGDTSAVGEALGTCKEPPSTATEGQLQPLSPVYIT